MVVGPDNATVPLLRITMKVKHVNQLKKILSGLSKKCHPDYSVCMLSTVVYFTIDDNMYIERGVRQVHKADLFNTGCHCKRSNTYLNILRHSM